MTDKPYAVGYGKPPVGSQFKAGQSGNPKGRPKAAPTFTDLLLKESGKQITVTQGGKAIKMSQLQVMAKALYAKAMKGDIQSAKLIVQLLAAAPEPPTAEMELSAADLALLDKLLAQEAKAEAHKKGSGHDT